MNIVLKELRSNRKSLIIWCSCMILLIAVGMIKYQGFVEMGEEANELLNSMPDIFKRVFSLDKINLSEISGYYAIFNIYFSLIAGIHAVLLGSLILIKEERDKTADFLMVKPIKRSRIVTSKIIAAVINMVILNAVTLITSMLFVNKLNKGASITSYILKIIGTLLILQFVFFSIGMMISMFTKSAKRASGISTSILLATYILSIVIGMYDKINFIRYAIPFYYFDAKKILITGKIETVYIVISIAIILAGIALTYKKYQYRDINA
ncbi:ABC transporter permease subunit [Clostridiaceae bacterium M8S5]|nr:ABC transporter permease subunit [Clostridiaceae bacterium M8S5]